MKVRNLVNHFRRFRSDRSAVASIEFAMLAPLVIVMIFSAIEAGWIMTQSMMLDTAVNRASRTMQIGGKATTYAQFKNLVCSNAVILRDCESSVAIELTPVDKAADVPSTAAPCVNRALPVQPITAFNVGKGSQIIYGRACYVVDPLTPGLGFALALAKDATGGLRLTARFAFVNEPT